MSSSVPPGWYAAGWSDRLPRGRVVPMTIAGHALALARCADGTLAALEDRCPHRNAPLSAGRVAGQVVECGYHGWRFDSSGRCVAIPGLADDLVSARGRAVGSWPARDAHGVAWIALGDAPAEPPHPARLGEPGWAAVRFDARLSASIADATENILDVPHTAFLHGGLFRRDTARRPIEVVIRRGTDRAEAEFLGEPPPSGLIGRLLAPGVTEVTHVDRFVAPCIAEVVYGLGASRGIHATHFLTPIDDATTQLHSLVCHRLAGGALMSPLVRLLGRRVLAQDARVLASQQRNMARHGGERFTSTELDVLGAHVRQLLRGVGGPEPERRVTILV